MKKIALLMAVAAASLAQPKAGAVPRPCWEEDSAWRSAKGNNKPKPKGKGKGKGKRGKGKR